MSGFKLSEAISSNANSANTKADSLLENGYKLYSKSNCNANIKSIDYQNSRALIGQDQDQDTFYPDPNYIFIPKSDLLKHTITFDACGTFLFRNIVFPFTNPPDSTEGPKITFGVKFSTIDDSLPLLGSITTTNVIPRRINPWPNSEVGNWRYTLTVIANPKDDTDTYYCKFVATLMESGFDGVWSSRSVMGSYTGTDALENIQNAKLSFVADGIGFPSQNINDVIYITKHSHTVNRVG